MKLRIILVIIYAAISFHLQAQESDTLPKEWSFSECIEYALIQNIQVRQSILTNFSNKVNKAQAKAERFPSVSASVSQGFSWSKPESTTDEESSFSGSNSTSFGINSNIIIYNGNKLNNLIKQAELDFQSGYYDSETVKESITLSLLNAFLQVVYSEEKVNNVKAQMDATASQLTYSEARLESGIISRSDYLQVKSQLASEKLSYANAKSDLAIAKVNLMQVMELPVLEDFSIIRPNMDSILNNNIAPVAADVYAKALEIKPEIKSVAYKKESAALNERIAAAGYYPTLTASAGVSTGYSSFGSTDFSNQVSNQLTPNIGLTLSIPIFQKKQVKSNVSLARINYQATELQEIETKNQLRKEIEQVCVDVVAAQLAYEASSEKYHSNLESYVLAEERFNNGLINSVDFLFEKNNQIEAESELLQSKFNLIFSYKILDFYTGNPITFN